MMQLQDLRPLEVKNQTKPFFFSQKCTTLLCICQKLTTLPTVASFFLQKFATLLLYSFDTCQKFVTLSTVACLLACLLAFDRQIEQESRSSPRDSQTKWTAFLFSLLLEVRHASNSRLLACLLAGFLLTAKQNQSPDRHPEILELDGQSFFFFRSLPGFYISLSIFTRSSLRFKCCKLFQKLTRLLYISFVPTRSFPGFQQSQAFV